MSAFQETIEKRSGKYVGGVRWPFPIHNPTHKKYALYELLKVAGKESSTRENHQRLKNASQFPV
jgi:hypothetical protein